MGKLLEAVALPSGSTVLDGARRPRSDVPGHIDWR